MMTCGAGSFSSVKSAAIETKSLVLLVIKPALRNSLCIGTNIGALNWVTRELPSASTLTFPFCSNASLISFMPGAKYLGPYRVCGSSSKAFKTQADGQHSPARQKMASQKPSATSSGSRNHPARRQTRASTWRLEVEVDERDIMEISFPKDQRDDAIIYSPAKDARRCPQFQDAGSCPAAPLDEQQAGREHQGFN